MGLGRTADRTRACSAPGGAGARLRLPRCVCCTGRRDPGDASRGGGRAGPGPHTHARSRAGHSVGREGGRSPVGGLTLSQAAALLDSTFSASSRSGSRCAWQGAQPPVHAADRPRLRRAEDRPAGQHSGERHPAGARRHAPRRRPAARQLHREQAGASRTRSTATPTQAAQRPTEDHAAHVKLRRARMGWSIDAKALASGSTRCSPTRMRGGSSAPSASACPRGERPRPAQAYPTVVTIDRAHFKLRLFKNLRWSRTYGIAVGTPGTPRPPAATRSRTRPSTRLERSRRAMGRRLPQRGRGGRLPGQPAQGALARDHRRRRHPRHRADYSIGTRASHGCIRMHVADVIDLYPRVPVGTPVLIR